MSASNFLELYTAIVAWNIYGSLLAALTETGLIYLPFIALMADGLYESRQRKDAHYELQKVQNQTILMTIVICVAVVPTFTITAPSMKFNRLSCEAGSAEGSIRQRIGEMTYLGEKNTGYDSAGGVIMAGGNSVSVPAWWYLWNSIAHGITDVATLALPCNTDVRTIAADVSSLVIEDPQLRNEANAFYQQCWRPAVSDFFRLNPEVPESLKDRISEDISWPGSEFFQQTPGYYDHYRATTPLKSFPYDQARDGAIVESEHAEGGYPHCNEWWSSDSGLRSRLVETFQPSLIDRIRLLAMDSDHPVTTANVQDALLRETLTQDSKLQGSLTSLASRYDDGSYNGDDLLQNIAVSAGLAFNSATHYTKIKLVKQLAPVVQAILLMFFIMVLPLLIIISNFDLGFIVTFAFIYFSVIFWAFLFEVADWIDNFLLNGTVFGDGVSGNETLQGIVSGFVRDANFTWAVDFITSALYVVMPALFTALLGLAGYRVGQEVSQGVSSWTSSAAGAGASGVENVKGGLKK